MMRQLPEALMLQIPARSPDSRWIRHPGGPRTPSRSAALMRMANVLRIRAASLVGSLCCRHPIGRLSPLWRARGPHRTRSGGPAYGGSRSAARRQRRKRPDRRNRRRRWGLRQGCARVRWSCNQSACGLVTAGRNTAFRRRNQKQNITKELSRLGATCGAANDAGLAVLGWVRFVHRGAIPDKPTPLSPSRLPAPNPVRGP